MYYKTTAFVLSSGYPDMKDLRNPQDVRGWCVCMIQICDCTHAKRSVCCLVGRLDTRRAGAHGYSVDRRARDPDASVVYISDQASQERRVAILKLVPHSRMRAL